MSDIDWVPACDVRQRLGSIGVYPRSIIEHLEDGTLRSRAYQLFRRYGTSRQTVATDVDVEQSFWAEWARDKHHHDDWATGTFRYEGYRHGSVVDRAVGVTFAGDDLARLYPALTKRNTGNPSLTPELETQRRKGGSSGKVELWHEFWKHALELVHSADIDRFESQAKLRKAMLSHIDDGLHEDTVKQHVSWLWYTFGPGRNLG